MPWNRNASFAKSARKSWQPPEKNWTASDPSKETPSKAKVPSRSRSNASPSNSQPESPRAENSADGKSNVFAYNYDMHQSKPIYDRIRCPCVMKPMQGFLLEEVVDF